MERIKDIVQRHTGVAACYEIAFRPRRHSCPEEIKSVYCSDLNEFAPDVLRTDVDPLELWAHDADLLGEDDYNAVFPGYSDFEELYDSHDAQVLVIWLTRLSYEILTNPEIKTVREFRLDDIGKYHDYYVVSRVRDCTQPRHDDWEDEEEYFDQDEDHGSTTNNHVERFKVRSGTKDQLDKLFAWESILVPADDLGLRYELEGADAWWDEETPLEHFGREDADVLLIVLA